MLMKLSSLLSVMVIIITITTHSCVHCAENPNFRHPPTARNHKKVLDLNIDDKDEKHSMNSLDWQVNADGTRLSQVKRFKTPKLQKFLKRKEKRRNLLSKTQAKFANVKCMKWVVQRVVNTFVTEKGKMSAKEVHVSLVQIMHQMHLEGFKPFKMVAGGLHVSAGQLDIVAFIDLIGECASRNDYLMKFICGAKKEWGRHISDRVIKQTVLMTLFLHRATKRIISKPKTLKKLIKHFKMIRKKYNYTKHFGWFEKVKLWAVELAMGGYMKAQRRHRVSPKKGKYLIPLNIYEAVLKDYTRGNKANAKAGRILAKNNPGKPGDGRPTTLAGWKKQMSYKFPQPRKWADLYATWNLAFVSQFDAYPIYYAKLLAPVVSCYQRDPTLYIYHRAIALYVFVNWIGSIGGVKRVPSFLGLSDAENKALSDDAKLFVPRWSELNKESALEYQKSVPKKPGVFARLKRAWRKFRGESVPDFEKGYKNDVKKAVEKEEGKSFWSFGKRRSRRRRRRKKRRRFFAPGPAKPEHDKKNSDELQSNDKKHGEAVAAVGAALAGTNSKEVSPGGPAEAGNPADAAAFS